MSASQERNLNCFKAYDVRGRIPDELNEDLAYDIGRSYAKLLSPSTVCVGRDMRLSSPEMLEAVARGLNDCGCDVIDIGMCPTEEIYFVTSDRGLDGGVMVTASHNPKDYNGMKFVREQSKPISGDTGLKDMARFIVEGDLPLSYEKKGGMQSVDTKDGYVDHLLSYVKIEHLKELTVVMNCGNGCAGPVLDKLEPHLPFRMVKLFPEPDGTFPNGIPNPLLPENRGVTTESVLKHKADLGIAWDGDCDRCFFFDERGEFVEGYYIVGFMAQAYLKKNPGSKIVHDPRLVWNTVEMVKEAGGIPVMSKAGHAFIKERMRTEDALYGGEMSAHHYFRGFAYCDSGMIPWLLLLGTLCEEGRSLSELIEDRIAKYPVSGEINREVSDPHAVFKRVEEEYASKGDSVDHTDGLSVEFENWRFNLRPSNTEPVIRLNVEARGDKDLVGEKAQELLDLIGRVG